MLRRLTRSALLLAALAAALAGPVPAALAQADPDQGPGGPILVVAGSDGFGRFYPEILRAEGLNEFAVAGLGALNAQTLSGYQVVILARTALTDAQAAALGAWVNAGGNLIAMRPDPRLAPLLGLAPAGGTLANGYLRVDTSSAPGAGIVGDTIQFHDSADRYTAPAARSVATLYAGAATPTGNPAVTLRGVGAAGGEAAAFTYDLARSIVYTRQGNPAWAGKERDGLNPIRSDDLFFGNAAGDPQPDWVNLDKVAIPQADEQQRLLANLITQMTADRLPLPRFWYLPHGKPAAVVMTGDDHGSAGGTDGQFAMFEAASSAGCSVADWGCVRATSYVYPNATLADPLVDQAKGFEIALHLKTGNDPAPNFTAASLETNWNTQLPQFTSKWPGLARPRTNRTHAIVWSDWATQPIVERGHGIRLDTNYYYWPAPWVNNRPGMFTGSGFPMRFANTDGSLIDVYQATTQLTDELGSTPWSYVGPHIRALLDRALAQGFYGAFTVNMHTDEATHPGAVAIVAEAAKRGVPVVSAAQLLDWTDGRNSSAFQGVRGSGGRVEFAIAADGRARGLQAMLPLHGPGGVLQSLTVNGAPVATAVRNVKGIDYAVFAGAAGAYVATYPAAGTGTPPPTTKPRRKRDRTAPRVTLKRKTVRANRRGIIKLGVHCPRTEKRCFIDLRLRTLKRKQLAKVKFTVAGRKTAPLKLRLPRGTRGHLARAGKLKLVVRIQATDRARNRRTTLTTIRVLAPRGR